MCFLPIEDYPLYRRTMLDGAAAGHAEAWVNNHQSGNAGEEIASGPRAACAPPTSK